MSNLQKVFVISLSPRVRPSPVEHEPVVQESPSTSAQPENTLELGRLLASYQEQNSLLTTEGAQLNDKLIAATWENKRLIKLMAEVVVGARKDRLRAESVSSESNSTEEIEALRSELDQAQRKLTLSEAKSRKALAALV